MPQLPLPSHCWVVIMLLTPLHVVAPHGLDEPGYTHMPPVSQSVAPHVPPVMQFAVAEQQWPVPAAPQTPLEHCALAPHACPTPTCGAHDVPLEQ
jgi:hypothetical protein